MDPAQLYLDDGGKEGLQPGPLFDGVGDLEQNPDVSAAGINPLVRYIVKHGSRYSRVSVRPSRQCGGVPFNKMIQSSKSVWSCLHRLRIASATSGFAYSKSRLARPKASTVKVAILIHAYYVEVFKEIIEILGDVEVPHKLFVTTVPDNEAELRSVMESKKFDYEIMVCENRGRDVLPFLSVLKNIDLDSYPFILKLHTKKSLHREDGDRWRQDICSCLAKPKQLDWILRQMCSAPNIGLVGPQDHVISMGTYYGANRKNVNWLASKMGIENVDPVHDNFIAGTMFVARSDALRPILSLALCHNDFEPELSQVDGTMAHAVERVLSYSAKSAGFEIASVGKDDAAGHVALRASTNTNYVFADPTPIELEGATKKFSFKSLIRLLTGSGDI